VLGELYGKYQQLQHLTESDIASLESSKQINLRRQKLHDAAGINDDYPVGRGIFKED